MRFATLTGRRDRERCKHVQNALRVRPGLRHVSGVRRDTPLVPGLHGTISPIAPAEACRYVARSGAGLRAAKRPTDPTCISRVESPGALWRYAAQCHARWRRKRHPVAERETHRRLARRVALSTTRMRTRIGQIVACMHATVSTIDIEAKRRRT